MKNIDISDPTVDPKKLYKDFCKWRSEDGDKTGLWSFIINTYQTADHLDLNLVYGGVIEWAGIPVLNEDDGETDPNYENNMESVTALIRAWEKCGLISVKSKGKTHRGEAYEVYFK